MAEEQFKRNIAYKIRVGDISLGKPVTDGERFSFLELGDKKIIRINVVGNIVDKFEGGAEKKYIYLTIDDGSGQITLRIFGDDVERFKNIGQGQTVIVIGSLRRFNDETYVSPEIIRELEPRYLIIRKLETERDKQKNSDPLKRDQIVAVKDKILGTIKNAEEDGGIEIDQVIMLLKDISPVIINQEIQKLLEEGIIFEPRPGKVRYLG